jgi:hypothetical protein
MAGKRNSRRIRMDGKGECKDISQHDGKIVNLRANGM